MTKIVALILLVCCFNATSIIAQKAKISILDSGKNVSIRGLSVVNNNTIWCSASKGKIAKSTNGGKSFEWLTVNSYEDREFRDIEAFDENTAVIIGIGEPAIILKTKDGGKSWKIVLEDSTAGMFLDAMAFQKNGKGMVIGDPINGKLYQARTNDFGETWIALKTIPMKGGESFFASSGSNIVTTNKNKKNYLIVSGGMISRLLYKEKWINIPLLQGEQTTGANSIACYQNKAVIAGGDFSKPQKADSNFVLLNLKGKLKISTPIFAPLGYKSCVIYFNKNILIACGTTGVDISFDAGQHWQNISKENFHVVQKAKKGNAIFLAGANGKIAKLNLSK